MFELRDLEYFLAIIEHKSFHRAAKHLNIAQPPLSRRIAALERELGGQLFSRAARQISLTETGRVFAEEARAILYRAELAKHIVQDMGRGFRGQLRLGYVDATGYAMVPKAIASFRTEFPRSIVTLTELRSRRQAEALRAGTIDVGIHRGTPDHEGLTVRRLRSDKLVAVLPKKHRLASERIVAIESLTDELFVTLGGQAVGGVPDLVRTVCARAGFVPNVVQEVDGVAALLGCVEVGLGIALVDDSMRDLPFSQVTYRQIAPVPPSIDLNILTRSGDSNPLIAPFVRHLSGVVSNVT